MLGRRPGVPRVEANPVAQTATVTYDPERPRSRAARLGRGVRLPLRGPLGSRAHLRSARRAGPRARDHAGVERADEAHGHGHGGHAGMSMARDGARHAQPLPRGARVRDADRAVVAARARPVRLDAADARSASTSTSGSSLLSLPVVFYSSSIFFTGAWRRPAGADARHDGAGRRRDRHGLALLGRGHVLDRGRGLLRGGGRAGRASCCSATGSRCAPAAGPTTPSARCSTSRRRRPSCSGTGSRSRSRPRRSRSATCCCPPGRQGPGRRGGRSRARARSTSRRSPARACPSTSSPATELDRRDDQQERHPARPRHRGRLRHRARADRQARPGGPELEGPRPAAGRPRRLLARAGRARRRPADLRRLVLRRRPRRPGRAAVRHHRRGHHLPRRARPGDADGDHGRHRAGRQARHPVQERDRARAGRRARHRRARQDRHAHARASPRSSPSRPPTASTRPSCCASPPRVERESEHPLAEAIVRPRRARGSQRAARRAASSRARARRARDGRRPPARGRQRRGCSTARAIALDGLAGRADELAGEGRTVVHVARRRRAPPA